MKIRSKREIALLWRRHVEHGVPTAEIAANEGIGEKQLKRLWSRHLGIYLRPLLVARGAAEPRRAYTLHYLEGLTFRETILKLGLPYDAATKGRITTAAYRYKKKLEAEVELSRSNAPPVDLEAIRAARRAAGRERDNAYHKRKRARRRELCSQGKPPGNE